MVLAYLSYMPSKNIIAHHIPYVKCIADYFCGKKRVDKWVKGRGKEAF